MEASRASLTRGQVRRCGPATRRGAARPGQRGGSPTRPSRVAREDTVLRGTSRPRNAEPCGFRRQAPARRPGTGAPGCGALALAGSPRACQKGVSPTDVSPESLCSIGCCSPASPCARLHNHVKSAFPGPLWGPLGPRGARRQQCPRRGAPGRPTGPPRGPHSRRGWARRGMLPTGSADAPRDGSLRTG